MSDLTTKLAKVGAMAFLAASDLRTKRRPSRVPALLESLADWIERDEELGQVVQAQLEVLGKQLGFEVHRAIPVPGSKEKH